eukprot:07991.XXX_281374_280746_1 [CDS] Oithona nana genome sequencing.
MSSHESSRRGSIIRTLYGSQISNSTLENGQSEYETDPFLGKLRRSSLDRFYKLERTQYCKGYSYVAFGCFFFTFFLFFIKIIDCTEENCFESYNYEDGMSWTLQSMIAIGTISAFCFILGYTLMKVAKHREKFRGYQEI